MGMPVRRAHRVRMGVSMPLVPMVPVIMPPTTMIVSMNMADGRRRALRRHMRVSDLDEGGNDPAHMNVIT